MDQTRQELFELTMRRAAELLTQHGVARTATSNPFFDSPQDERRAHALAVLQTCGELTAQLERLSEDAARQAHRAQASYAEIGAARGVSRQAARQAAARQKQRLQTQQAAYRAARRSALDDDQWEDREHQRLAQEERDERWPPRSWRYRAPAGYRTVTLIDGPAKDHTFRVSVGDDAFPFIDRYEVFGRIHDRYARYAAATPGSNQYSFTGEYFIRWS
ncbi:hypothetical protein [Micromonospora carbonacea]|uniref:Uncharacterized protein n=1 Tax=Micromonospora carbonacea TaxID=47853 RepID=A0A1C5AYB4_9ACTN|nr:hypothetical protein [Micromonospora carbonacea]SCF50044.1 hypothetical protein GA0070563_12619 [Micromonospora carbonacea]